MRMSILRAMTSANQLLGLWLLCGVLTGSLGDSGEGKRVSAKIYVFLNSNAQCFRLFNATHQIGCQSSRYGDTGTVFLVDSDQDIEDVQNDPNRLGPFIAAVDFKRFATAGNLPNILRSCKKISGVLLLFPESYSDEAALPPYSADAACPTSTLEGYPGCAPGVSWNEAGQSHWLESWDKPVFLLNNQTEIDIITQTCFDKTNKGTTTYPRCGVRLKFWMFGAVDTPTCLRRNNLFDGINTGSTMWKTCAPMSDMSVFATLPPMNASVPSEEPAEGSVMVLATRMDSISMFSEVTPGLQSSLVGVTILLSVAEALGRDSEQFSALKTAARANKRSLLFAFFNGEALDFIGSSRLLWDMQNKLFPAQAPFDKAVMDNEPWGLEVKHLGFVLEAGQAAFGDEGFFAHVNATVYNEKKTLMDGVIASMGLSPKVVEQPAGVFPPASYSSFLRAAPSLPGLLLSDFEKSFRNQYFNSFLDSGARLSPRLTQTKAALVSAAEGFRAAAVSWVSADGAVPDVPLINASFVGELFDCFAASGSWLDCRIFANAVPPYAIGTKEVNLLDKLHVSDRTYITPEGGGRSSVRLIVNGTLSFFLGERRSVPRNECANAMDHIFTYSWLRRPNSDNDSREFCVVAPIYLRPAYSPAFDLEEGDSRVYSTWTESTWSSGSMEVFLMASSLWEWMVLALGSVVFGLSFALTWGADRKADLLFPPPPVNL